MARWGVFEGRSEDPAQVVEGARISQDNEFVRVFDEQNKQVAAVRLAQGQILKKISD